MNNLLYINKNGATIPVYDINNESRQIGYLNDREAFVMYDSNGSNRLYIYFPGRQRELCPRRDQRRGHDQLHLKFYTEYPVKKEYIEGNQYLLFKMRKSMPVYYADANRWGTVAAELLCGNGSQYLWCHPSRLGVYQIRPEQQRRMGPCRVRSRRLWLCRYWYQDEFAVYWYGPVWDVVIESPSTRL